MNAPGSFPDAATAAEQRAHEPSMEEILASIRRIIADDQMLPLTRTSAPPAPVRHEEEAVQRFEEPAVLEVPAPRAPRIERVVAERPAALAEPVHYAPPAVARPAVRPRAPEDVAPARTVEAETRQHAAPATRSEDSLLSPTTGASVSNSFEALANTMFLQNTGFVEEAMRDMLRPMLRQWLDNNLPTMVERLVRTEIERVARGGRS